MTRGRFFIIPWLRVIVALATLATLAAFLPAARAGAPELRPVQVSEHVWYVQGDSGMASAANQGFNSNAGFVVTRDSVVVIDALGTPPLGEALVAAIRRVSDKPIRRVILTHYHADHFYGLAAFKAAGAEVWAHRAGREYFTSGEAAARLAQRRTDLFPWVDEHTRLIEADRWLDGDTRFEAGGLHFRVSFLGPAHSSEDLLVSVDEDGVVFCGDILFAGRIPFVGSADSKRWLAAIDVLAGLRPKVLVTGHGPHSTFGAERRSNPYVSDQAMSRAPIARPAIAPTCWPGSLRSSQSLSLTKAMPVFWPEPAKLKPTAANIDSTESFSFSRK